MNVRKRGLALLMCICMIFTLLPFSALAETGVASDAEPPVSVESSGDNGVKLKKTVTKQDDDTYKVTLEQYVTGTVTQGTVTPIDVVLVLDVSGSMSQDFRSTKFIATYDTSNHNKSYSYYVIKNNRYIEVSWCNRCNAFTDGCFNFFGHHHGEKFIPKTSENDNTANAVQFYVAEITSTKMDALKLAVNKFINTIADKNKDSRIAIVTFSDNAIIKNQLTSVSTGISDLRNTVNSLRADGSTAADYGLEKAKSVFSDDTSNTGHQRVVIMFTDGEPNHYNGFDYDVANNAINHAKTLKSAAYGAKVYTIGIFKNANVGSDLPDDDRNGRTNRYMHLVSSNYPTAVSMTEIGTDGAVTNGYYKVASDASTLSDAFTQIGDAVGNPAITLGSTSVLTDVVAGNFTAPANADVKVYTADYNGSKFADRDDWDDITSSVSVDITGQNVTVSGFDYSANYVSTAHHPDNENDFGKKLIVEFTIKVDRDKTYGGTQPTNAAANISLNNEVVAYVDNPKVPVSITNGFSANYNDSKFYDGKGFDVKAAFEKMLQSNGLTTANNMNQYVDIAYEVKSGDTVVGTYTVKAGYSNGNWSNNDSVMTDSAVGTYTYNVTCKVTDKNNGSATYKTGVADGTGTMTLTITPLNTLTVSANGYEGKYYGQAHGGTVNASVEGSTIWYKIGENGEWTNTAPTIKNVDDEINGKTIYVKATKDNYRDSEVAQYTLTVTPRNVTLTSESATKAYDGTPLTKPDVTVGGDGFIDGEVTNIRAVGTVTNVEDSPVNNTIMYDTGANFRAANYNITKNEGTLTIYKATDAKATIEATKTLDNDAPGNVQFSFKLESTDGKDTRTIPNATNAPDGRIKFDLTYGKEGTYIYKLSEVKGTDTGIVYDETVYYVKVEVTLVEKEYEAKVSYFKDEACTVSLTIDLPTFNNTTAPGSLTISKTVSGNAASTTKEFTFTVTLMENGDPWNGEATYGGVTFTNGVATFELKAGDSKTITGIPAGFDYTVTESDNNGYTVTVNGQNTATATGKIMAGKPSNEVFNNHKSHVYPPNPPIMDEITVEITGNSDSVVYDGTEHSVKGYTVKISDPRYTEKDFTFTGKAEASGVNAGTYEMGLKAEQFKNTNARFTNVKFVIKADGVLTITPKDLTITAGSKTEYGPTPVTCGEWTVSGLAAGDKVESVKITGIQSVPGSSPNVPSDAVIKNAKGEDVTKNYAIKYVNGTLTMLEVLNKEDHFNYIIGTPEGLSLPTANVTRAEVATIFFRLMTDDARAKFDSLDNNFSDVAKGKWYNRAISTLANAGIIKGDPAGTYRPETRSPAQRWRRS